MLYHYLDLLSWSEHQVVFEFIRAFGLASNFAPNFPPFQIDRLKKNKLYIKKQASSNLKTKCKQTNEQTKLEHQEKSFKIKMNKLKDREQNQQVDGCCVHVL